MNRNRAEMRDAIKAAAKAARAGFAKAMYAGVEQAVSKIRAKLELCRRKYVEEAVRVSEDENRRRGAQEEEVTSSSPQSSVADKLLASASEKDEGEILRAVKETIDSVTA